MAENKTISFIKDKKKKFKETTFRQRFDKIVKDADANVLDTSIKYDRVENNAPFSSVAFVTERADGSRDFAIRPVVNKGNNGSDSRVPRSAEPISFAKIVTAVSVIASKAPDGSVHSTNKIKARLYYELWKRSWTDSQMNGLNTLQTAAQQMISYGTGAWRVFPKDVTVERKVNGSKIPKIIYDDIFREPLDIRRTWFGLDVKPSINTNRIEVLYEYDVSLDDYSEMRKKYAKRNAGNKGKQASMVSTEAVESDPDVGKNKVTIYIYENPLENRLVICSDEVVFYDDEMPNEQIYGSVVYANCFVRDMNDPHGVGLYELMRGNVALYNYINSMSAEQVEAEVFPLLFGSNMSQNGDSTYYRGPNRINNLPAGAKIDRVSSNGNVTLAINYAQEQKRNLEDNTGVNSIVAGSGSDQTLGGTMILKEAALARLALPRNSLAQAIENDAAIQFSWIEQDQVEERDFVFATESQIQDFMSVNKDMHHSSMEQVEFNDKGMPTKFKVKSSVRVPISFDYSLDQLGESGYDEQQIRELGDSNIKMSRSKLLKDVSDLESNDKLGYDTCMLKVDIASMITPSLEFQKQQSMQLLPILQNSLMQIYGLARQDPEQAIAQLTTLKTFLETQKEDIYKYIPRDQYETIMSGSMATPPPEMAAMTQGMTPDGTPPGQPQAPEEMKNAANNGSPMASMFNASIGRGAKG